MKPETFLEHFSSHLKNAIARAISLAASLEHPKVTPLHILLALSEESGSVAAEMIFRLKIEPKAILGILERQPKVRSLPSKTNTVTATLPELNRACKQMLERAMLTAYERGHNYIGTEHLLYALLQKPSSAVKTIIENHNHNIDQVIEELESILQNTSKFPDMEDVKDAMDQLEDMVETPPPPSSHPKGGVLAKLKPNKSQEAIHIFARDLTNSEFQKTLDPVIGRDKEIQRLIHILSRRTKNNPVLVGEPGVGKTAIVEGLAKRIVEGDVPDILKRKKILSLDLTLLIAGTIYRGEFEARLKQIIDEVTNKPNYILFIDELHNIIGAGSNQGTMDAANILKPALARGQLHCIGATTIDEYKKHISNDPALERRFQSIHVDEPSLEETKQILRGIKKHYEDFHHVQITDNAVDAAVELSERYIHDNFLPDKAIDLIDEASASVNAKRKATLLEQTQHKIEEELEKCLEQKEQAIHKEEFEKAVKLKKREDYLLGKKQELAKEKVETKPKKRKRVTDQDVARVVSGRLDIKESHLLQNQWEKVNQVAEVLREKIIGQDHVIDKLANALRQAYLSSDRKKPFSSMLFAGPSGVGKTELAKQIASALYHDPKALIRLDMSEFAEAHGVSKLLGSPAGYVGYKERNRFTDELKRRPYAVVLFDEFDKAHPDVQKLLLQILDEGELTESNGKKITLRHALVILTTNTGSHLYKSAGIGFGNEKSETGINEDVAKALQHELKDVLGDPIISRIETTCLFAPLTDEHVEKIVKKHLDNVIENLTKTREINITPDKQAIDSLAKNAYSEDTGIRHVESLVQKTVHELAIEILQNKKRKNSYTLTADKHSYKLV